MPLLGGGKEKGGQQVGVLYVGLLVWEQTGGSRGSSGRLTAVALVQGAGRSSELREPEAGYSHRRRAGRVSPSPWSHLVMGPAGDGGSSTGHLLQCEYSCLSFMTCRVPLKARF